MKTDISGELEIRTSRSGGKGGQHVNKVETQVEVRFSIPDSRILNQEQKEILLHKLAKRLNKENELILKCNETRTQIGNKEIAIQKIHLLLEHALQKRKARIATKVPKRIHEKRLEHKNQRGEIKKNRMRVVVNY